MEICSTRKKGLQKVCSKEHRPTPGLLNNLNTRTVIIDDLSKTSIPFTCEFNSVSECA